MSDPIDELVAAARAVLETHEEPKPPRLRGWPSDYCADIQRMATPRERWAVRRQLARERLRQVLLDVEADP